jgi:hypothetical protein
MVMIPLSCQNIYSEFRVRLIVSIKRYVGYCGVPQEVLRRRHGNGLHRSRVTSRMT